MEKIWYNSYDRDIPKSIDYPDLPLFEFLDQSEKTYPENNALIFMGKKISYRKLRELTDRFAIALMNLGVERGDRIALFLPNCPQYVIAFYGILKAGAIVVPNNPLLSEEELLYQIKDSGAKAIITLDLEILYPKVVEVKNRISLEKIIVSNLKNYLPFPKNLLFSLVKRSEISKVEEEVFWFEDLLKKPVLEPFAQFTLERSEGLKDKLREGEKEALKVEVDSEDIAAIFYTTGTTGKPKPVTLTHKNLVVNALQCKEWFKLREGKQIFLTSLPFFHSYALTTSLNVPILAGSTIITTPKFEVRETLKLIDHYGPTYFVGVPPIFEHINRYPKSSKYDFSSLRFAVSGASSLSTETRLKFENLTKSELIEGYGMTETSPVTHCQPREGKKKGIGIPLPDTDCKIVGLKEDKELLPGEEGELCVKGPQIMYGYWNREEESRKVLKDGWLYTGDIAKMDSSGYFEIIGRKKDLITVSLPEDMDGIHVYPEEIEKVIVQHPKVDEVGVVGIPSPLGEKIKAFVVKKENITSEEIIEFCKENLVNYKVPEEIEFIEELPKNIIGKVLRRELRQKRNLEKV